MRPVDIQRVRHIPRELLRSNDFLEQQSSSDQRRWWHNRAVHDAVGVASGFTVTLSQDNKSVVVQPGVAYDCFGHELLLFGPRTVALPPGEQPRRLVACQCEPRANAEPELRWRAPYPADRGECVELAELSYVDHQPDLTVGRRSRPAARPRIGYGATPPEGTPWQPWIVGGPESSDLQAIGLQVVIDTSAAGFTEPPCYFAWLQWPRVADSHLPYIVYVTLGFQYVEEPAIGSFLFRLLLPPEFLPDSGRVSHPENVLLSVARAQRLSVCWLGIQHEPGQPGGSHQEGA